MKHYHRSWLCSSSLRPELQQKLTESSNDVLFLDVEDSVPLARKAEARQRCVELLENRLPVPVALRINALTTAEGMADLIYFSEHRLLAEMVILPKVECSRDLRIAEQLLMKGGWRGGMFALIETPQAVHNIGEIASSGGLLAGFVFGAADLCAGMGVAIDGMGAAAVAAKREIAFAAAANRLCAIDSPCFHLDAVKLQEELSMAAELGFHGKVAVHPDQVDPINARFEPSRQEIERAQQVVQLSDQSNGGVFRFNGQMMGPPFAERARRVIERASLPFGSR